MSPEGVTVEAYWEEHGEASVDHARRYIRRIRKLLADEHGRV